MGANLKKASYFTSKMHLCVSSRENAIQDELWQTMGSLEIKGKEHYFIEKSRKLGGLL